MPEHVKITEEVTGVLCYLGECEHEDDCPPIVMDVCVGCVDTDRFDDEILWYTPWEVAERNGHAYEGDAEQVIGDKKQTSPDALPIEGETK